MQLTVSDLESGQRLKFPCGQWLATDEGDGQIARNLYPVKKGQDLEAIQQAAQQKHGECVCTGVCVCEGDGRIARKLYPVKKGQDLEAIQQAAQQKHVSVCKGEECMVGCDSHNQYPVEKRQVLEVLVVIQQVAG